ncbi:MAG: hypothetical protein ACR2O1_11135 [Boseongicola sp.]
MVKTCQLKGELFLIVNGYFFTRLIVEYFLPSYFTGVDIRDNKSYAVARKILKKTANSDIWNNLRKLDPIEDEDLIRDVLRGLAIPRSMQLHIFFISDVNRKSSQVRNLFREPNYSFLSQSKGEIDFSIALGMPITEDKYWRSNFEITTGALQPFEVSVVPSVVSYEVWRTGGQRGLSTWISRGMLHGMPVISNTFSGKPTR